MAYSSFKPAALSTKTAKAAVSKALIQGTAIGDQFEAMSQAAQKKFTATLLTSIQSGETLSQLAARMSGGVVNGEAVPGFLSVTRQQSTALSHTAITAVSKQDRIEAFRANADVISAVQQVSTLDNRTTDICIAYSDLTWDVNTLEPIGHSLPWAGGPPRHFNCRSVIVPVVKSPEELGVKTRNKISDEVRATMDGQKSSSLTFDKWLSGKSENFQNEVLGVKKAKLFREGKLDLRDLINFNARPLSVQALVDTTHNLASQVAQANARWKEAMARKAPHDEVIALRKKVEAAEKKLRAAKSKAKRDLVESQVAVKPKPPAVEPDKLKPAPLKDVPKELDTDYVYHVTNEENLKDIVESGRLATHKPGFGTDQSTWPDGSVAKRSYFTQKRSLLDSFAPEEGKPVVIRMKDGGALHREASTGDIFIEKNVKIAELEFLAQDGKWHPLSELLSKADEVVAKPKLPAVSAAIKRHKGAEMVSLDDLQAIAAEDRRLAGKGAANITENTETLLPRLTKAFKAGDEVQEPLVIAYDTKTGKALLIDGNTRLVALQDAGFSHAPVIVVRQDLHGYGVKLSTELDDVIKKKDWIKPSELGFKAQAVDGASGVASTAPKRGFAPPGTTLPSQPISMEQFGRVLINETANPREAQLMDNGLSVLRGRMALPNAERKTVVTEHFWKRVGPVKFSTAESRLEKVAAEYFNYDKVIKHYALSSDSSQSFRTLVHEFGHHIHISVLDGYTHGEIKAVFKELSEQSNAKIKAAYSRMVEEYKHKTFLLAREGGFTGTIDELYAGGGKFNQTSASGRMQVTKGYSRLAKGAHSARVEAMGVSDYSHTNEMEWFAENFSHYFGSVDDVSYLRTYAPDSFDFFETLFKEFGG